MAVGLTVNLLTDNAELKKGLKDAERRFDRFSRGIGQTMGKAFKAGGLALAAGLGAGVAAAGSLIHELETAQNNLTKATGATGDALKALVADARALLPQVPENLDGISKVLGEVNTQWGLAGKEQQAATKLMLDWARVTDTDGVQATFNLAAGLRVFGEDASYAGEALGDILKGTQGTGVAADAVLKQFAKFSPLLAGVGLNAEQASALLIQMGSAGIRVSTVMEGLGTFQTTMAKEGKDARREFERWIELFSRSEEGAYDAGEAARLFGTTALPLWEQLGRAGVIDPDAWGFGDSAGYVEEQAEAVKTISERWKQAANALKAAVLPAIVTASEWITGTLLPAVQDKLVPAIQSAGSELVSRVQPAFAAIAGWVQDSLVPAFRDNLLPELQALAGWLRDNVWPDLVRISVRVSAIAAKTAAWGKALGGEVLEGVEQAARWVGRMYEHFSSGDWKGAFDEFTRGPVDESGAEPWWAKPAQLGLAAVAFNQLAKASRLLVGALLKVGNAVLSPLVAIRKAAGKFGKGMERLTSAALKPVTLILKGLTTAAINLGAGFLKIGNTKLANTLFKIVAATSKLSQRLGKVAPLVGKVAGKVSVLGTAALAVVDLWKTWTDSTKGLTDKIADTALAIAPLVAAIAVAVAGVAAWPVVLGAAIGAGIALVVKFRREIWDFAKRFKAVGAAVLAVVSGPFGLVAAAVTLLVSKFGLLDKAVSVVRTVVGALSAVFNTVVSAATSLGNAVGGYVVREFKRSWSEAKVLAGYFSGPFQAAWNLIGTVASAAASVARNVWDKVVTQIDRVIGWVQWMRDQFAPVGRAASDAAGLVVKAFIFAKGPVLAVVDEIMDKFGALKTFTSRVAGSIKGFFGGVGSTFRSVVRTVQSAFNKGIDAINAAIDVYNSIPILPNIGKIGHVNFGSGTGGGYQPSSGGGGGSGRDPNAGYYQPQQGQDFGSPANRGAQTVNIYMPAGSDARAVFNAVQERQNRGETLRRPGHV